MNDFESRLSELRRHPTFLARSIHWLAETASTQDNCRRLTEASGESLAVIADRQTAGRGQYGRRWEAPPALGLLMSVSLPGPPPEIPALSMWAAAAAAIMLETQFGLEAKVKWPNDVLLGGKKIAGLLAEVRGFAVIGVGINVLQQPDDFPSDCRLPPTSIAMETGLTADRVAVAAALLDELERLGKPTESDTCERIVDAWKERLDVQPGDAVTATLSDVTYEGELLAIDLRDGLQLQTESSRIRIPLERLLRLELATR
jgi:BirA family transcriptional regulator, biotin operon repressor / biotin---[acetyl-CoA-carboxylase] ligase